MKLLTQQQFAQLLEHDRRRAAVKEAGAVIDFRPVGKLFYLRGAATWLLTEINPEDHTVALGLCNLGMGSPEFGTVSLTELRVFHGRLGLERDHHFEASKAISAYIEETRRLGRIDA